MDKYILTTRLGDYEYEVIENKGQEYVATISKLKGNRYLKKSEVPKEILKILRIQGYKIELLNVDILNACLGLSTR